MITMLASLANAIAAADVSLSAEPQGDDAVLTFLSALSDSVQHTADILATLYSTSFSYAEIGR